MGWIIYLSGSLMSMWVIWTVSSLSFKGSLKITILVILILFLAALGSWFTAVLIWFQREDILETDTIRLKAELYKVIGDDFEEYY